MEGDERGVNFVIGKTGLEKIATIGRLLNEKYQHNDTYLYVI